jgi:hypothetical protein
LLSLIATAGGGDLIAAAVDVAAAGWPVAAVNDQMTNDQTVGPKQPKAFDAEKRSARDVATAQSQLTAENNSAQHQYQQQNQQWQ